MLARVLAGAKGGKMRNHQSLLSLLKGTWGGND